jgi:ParB family transcriptional regulator, chromosome partitioning protein
MVTPLKQYIDDISTFDEIETSLISFSSNPIRSTSDDVSELMGSIREQGLLEPIIVRQLGKRFEVVAGNRRLRACKLLKQRKVRCVVTDIDDATAYEVSMVENVQRRTLSPLDEAAAFKKYCETFGWGSQTQLAQKIGKSQEYVSHRMKLFNLPENARLALQSGRITPTAAQELAWIKDDKSAEMVLEMIKSEKLNTKAVRRLSKEVMTGGGVAGTRLYARPMKNEEDQAKLIKESILILRISMVRFDSVIMKVKDAVLKQQLLSKRLTLHQIVDDLIRVKNKSLDGASGQTSAPLPLIEPDSQI